MIGASRKLCLSVGKNDSSLTGEAVGVEGERRTSSLFRPDWASRPTPTGIVKKIYKEYKWDIS